MVSSWAYELFVKHGKIYYPILESLKEQAKAEVDFLSKIFDEFKVPRGCKILDLFCGIGSHSINLGRRGYEVVGYDPSPFFLRKARFSARHEVRSSKSIRFLHGKAEKPSPNFLKADQNSFNVILMLGSVLGYSTIHNDLSILRDLHKLASDDCLLITHTENRDWRIKNFQPHIVYRFEELIVHEMWRLNLENSIFEGDLYYYKVTKRGHWLHLLLSLRIFFRLYSLHEICDMLEKSGWQYLRSYDGFVSGLPASIDSENLITVSKLGRSP